MDLYTKEELQNILFSPLDYPLEFPDNIGLGYRDETSHSELRLKHPDGTRHVTLAIESFVGNEYSRAKHVYGRLVVDGVLLKQDWWNTVIECPRIPKRRSPIFAPEYVFIIKRPLLPIDMREVDGWGNLRWQGYRPGEYVMPFKSKTQLIEFAKRIFKQCFKGNWSLWMEDATGSGVTRELLVPGKLKNTSYEEYIK